jgi:malate-CoA ligase subunit beta
VRLAGTNVEEGRRILKESGLSIVTADTLAEAADRVVNSLNAYRASHPSAPSRSSGVAGGNGQP